jgi:hypothetical protein
VKLYVDDLRTPPAGWRLARTVEEAVRLLEAERFDEVSLDYVIGAAPGATFEPVARFIAAQPAERRPRLVYVHTSSPAGARALERILFGAVERVVRV